MLSDVSSDETNERRYEKKQQVAASDGMRTLVVFETDDRWEIKIMAEQDILRLRNGPNSDPAHIRMEVNGRIEGTDEAHIEFDLENETREIRFRGTITTFETSGGFSCEIDGVPYRAQEVVGYDTRDRTTTGRPKPPDPADPPTLDKYRPVELGTVEKDDAIGGGSFHEVENPNPREGFVSRYESTSRDGVFEIDENDSGGWQAFWNRLPKEINHRIEVHPSEGRHGGNGSSIRTHPMTFGSAGDLVIDGGHRDECRVEQGINSVSTGKLLNYQLRNVSFLGLSQFAGPVDIRECRFEGFDEPGANSSGTAAISGKNGHVHMKRSEVGGENDDYGIWATCSELYCIANCTLNGRIAAVNKNFGSELREWGNNYNAPRKFA